MARFPKFYGPYAVSDIIHPNRRSANFKGFGSDGTEDRKYGYVFYIGSDLLGRMILFKGFIENLQYTFSKGREEKTDDATQFTVTKEYSGKIECNVSLNIPAVSVNESRNNLAKIADLQRMLVPPLSGDFAYRAEGEVPKHLFSVFFVNLINSGLDYSGKPTINSYQDLFDHGMPSVIQEITYEPDMQMGFFEFDNYKFPKNIVLNLKFTFETTQKKTSKNKLITAIKAFNTLGCYDPSDSAIFPFLVKVKSDGFPEQVFGSHSGAHDFTVSSMNNIEYIGGTKESDMYFFLSLLVNKSEGGTGKGDDLIVDPAKHKRVRYVVFKPFFETFTRSVQTEVRFKEDKDFEIDTELVSQTFNEINYKIKMIVPSNDLTEAKKNSAKVQYLTRMFFKKSTAPGAEINDGEKLLKCYIPSKIERPGASSSPSNPGSFLSMYNNGIDVELESLKMEIDNTMGFFEDNGKIYPKVFSLDISLKINNNNLLTPFEPIELENKVKSFKVFSKEPQSLQFPFNRRYARISKQDAKSARVNKEPTSEEPTNPDNQPLLGPYYRETEQQAGQPGVLAPAEPTDSPQPRTSDSKYGVKENSDFESSL